MTRRRRLASVVAFALAAPAMAGMLAVQGAHGVTPAHTYYLSPGGSDAAAGTTSAPWATFGHALPLLQPGDTLILKDGEYHTALAPPGNVNGTATAPITIKAEHDGQARLNGDGARVPVALSGNDWLEIDGIVAYNSSQSVISIFEASDTNWASHDTLKRVSAYNSAATCQSGDAPSVCNTHLITIWGADHTLVEDCAAAGRARTIAEAQKTNFTTFRRCWFRGDKGTNWNGSDSPGPVTIYNSSNAIMENNVWSTSSKSGQHDWDNVYGGPEDPASTDLNKIVQVNKNNTYVGNVGLGMDTEATQCKLSRDHVYRDNVVGTIANRGSQNQTFDHMTVVGGNYWVSLSTYSVQDDNCSPRKTDPATGKLVNYGKWGFYKTPSTGVLENHDGLGFNFTSTLSNSVMTASYANATVEVNAQGPPAVSLDHDVIPSVIAAAGATVTQKAVTNTPLTFPTGTYGRGAYLLGATNAPIGTDGRAEGAKVVYETVNGVLTNTPLWPFPMEDRVWSETGDKTLWEGANAQLYTTRLQESVTWDGVDGRTGGIWKTLDGVYPPNTSTTTTTASTSTSTSTTTTTVKPTTTTSTTTTTLPPKFHAGDRIKVDGVRTAVYSITATDAVTQIGTQKGGSIGYVQAGPYTGPFGFRFYLIDFNRGLDGWVIDSTIVRQ